MKVLYIRTSTIEQNSERQKQNTDGNCKIIEDKCSGAVPFFERQGGKKILELTEKGIVDEIMVHEIDRLGRNLIDILKTISYFNNHNIDFLFGAVKKYKIMHGYKKWKIKWSFGFYSSHSVGFFIKRDQHINVGYYNSSFLSADLDFFYKMIVNYKLKGMATKKNEVLGSFEKGGFSSKINYIDHLKDLNNIRIHNKQSKFFVYLIFLFKIFKKPMKFLNSLKKYD